MQKIKIILSIRSLEIGGAERQFIELVKGIDKSKFEVVVITMFEGTNDWEIKNNSEIKFYCFDKRGRYDVLSYFKYSKLIYEFKPEVIYSFMSDLNIISFICSKFVFSKTKIIWGIRCSIIDLNIYGLFSKFAFYIQKKISTQIEAIIYNSYTSEVGHTLSSFKPKNKYVIQNGIDSEKFHRNENLRQDFRNNYGINNNDIVIGITSRIDPIKGYFEFCKAASKLLDKYTNLYFFSIGYGNSDIQKKCEILLTTHNQSKFFWLGKQSNPEIFMSGWDIYCSASLPGEGFPNAIAEAMLCELAPVVTESGDSAIIVEGVGLVAKPSNFNDLGNKLETMIKNTELHKIGLNSRNKIVNHFSISKMVSNTEEIIVKVNIKEND
jgi:glycosyltransferase involved in cell wall biosynthesis